MGLNDFLRMRREGGKMRIDLRSTPGQLEPTLTISEGYITLGGPPADPATVESGSLYFDPATGTIKNRGAMEEVP